MTEEGCNKFAKPKKRLSLRLALGLAARVTLLTLPVWALPLMSVKAAIIFSSPFELGYSEWRNEQFCCGHSAELVSSPVRAGNKALKVTYKKTDGQDTKRAELAGDFAPGNSERWYGISIYVPTSFTTTEGSFIITQFHDQPDDGEAYKIPPLFLATNGQRLTLGNRWDTRKITPPRDVQRQDWDLGLLPKGRWVDFVFHVKWSHQSDGILEVFQDGKMVVSKTGTNSYNDQSGPYMKLGMYASGIESHPEEYNFTQQEIYFDEVRVGDAGASYQDVSPRGNTGGDPDPEPNQEIRVEAEGMFLSAYRIESGNSAASGHALISLIYATAPTDTASSTFSGDSGKYDVYLGYFDENDAVANLQLSVGGVRLDDWQLNQDLGANYPTTKTLVSKKVASGLSINKGARIEIKGTADQEEWARVDYIDFVPVPITYSSPLVTDYLDICISCDKWIFLRQGCYAYL